MDRRLGVRWLLRLGGLVRMCLAVLVVLLPILLAVLLVLTWPG